jgi:hypothetical protein
MVVVAGLVGVGGGTVGVSPQAAKNRLELIINKNKYPLLLILLSMSINNPFKKLKISGIKTGCRA